MRGLSILAIAFAGMLMAGPALATACNEEIVVPIAFARGATQWVHRGPGTTYVGSFKKGQSLIIAGAGGTNYPATTNLGWMTASQDPWQLTLEGPDGFNANSDNGPLVVRGLPATGKYTLTIYPCADWGEPGTVMIESSPE